MTSFLQPASEAQIAVTVTFSSHAIGVVIGSVVEEDPRTGSTAIGVLVAVTDEERITWSVGQPSRVPCTRSSKGVSEPWQRTADEEQRPDLAARHHAGGVLEEAAVLQVHSTLIAIWVPQAGTGNAVIGNSTRNSLLPSRVTGPLGAVMLVVIRTWSPGTGQVAWPVTRSR